MSTRVSYTSSLITQGEYKLYSLTIPISTLSQTCFVDTREGNKENGFQRVLDEKRAEAIAKYIDSGGTIPGGIILSAQSDADFKYDSKKRTISFLNIEEAFLVLDGQHRVFGFQKTKVDLRIPVIVYAGLTRTQEARLFIDINTNQKPVPTELLLAIKKTAENETDREIKLRVLFDMYMEKSDSALLGHLSDSKKEKDKITRNTFYRALSPHLKLLEDKSDKESYSIFNNYIKANKFELSQITKSPVIANPTLFTAICHFFPDVARNVKYRYEGKYSLDNYCEVLGSVYLNINRNNILKPGKSYKDLLESFQDALKKDFSL